MKKYTCSLTKDQLYQLNDMLSQYTQIQKDGWEQQTRLLISQINEATFKTYWSGVTLSCTCGGTALFDHMQNSEGKLIFMDKIIKLELLKAGDASALCLQKNGIGRFSGWVLNRTLRQMKNNPEKAIPLAYDVPSDFKSLGEDLCFYHAARKLLNIKNENIAKYKSLQSFLNRIVDLAKQAKPHCLGKKNYTGPKEKLYKAFKL